MEKKEINPGFIEIEWGTFPYKEVAVKAKLYNPEWKDFEHKVNLYSYKWFSRAQKEYALERAEEVVNKLKEMLQFGKEYTFREGSKAAFLKKTVFNLNDPRVYIKMDMWAENLRKKLYSVPDEEQKENNTVTKD